MNMRTSVLRSILGVAGRCGCPPFDTNVLVPCFRLFTQSQRLLVSVFRLGAVGVLESARADQATLQFDCINTDSDANVVRSVCTIVLGWFWRVINFAFVFLPSGARHGLATYVVCCLFN